MRYRVALSVIALLTACGSPVQPTPPAPTQAASTSVDCLLSSEVECDVALTAAEELLLDEGLGTPTSVIVDVGRGRGFHAEVHACFEDAAYLVVGVIGPDASHVSASRRDQPWAVAPCEGSRELSGSGSPAEWRLVRESQLRPDGVSFDALVTERRCSGNRPIRDILLPPVIEYAAAHILVTLYVEPLDVGAVCIANDPTLFTIPLSEPIGNRVLVDGYVPPT
jgi:hypothetical protein